MNNIDNQIYRLYKDELQNLEIGYSINKANISKIIELICLNLYIYSGYPTDDEVLKYVRMYD